MAAHIMCHGNEMVPSTFPPRRPTSKDHGLMSEYEAPFVMHQTYPFAEVEGGLDVTFDEDQPIIHNHVPTMTAMPSFDLGEIYDMSLCVTPEKHNLRKTRTEKLNRGSDEGTNLKPHNSQKVRFENFVEVKQMSPEAPHSRMRPNTFTSISESSIPISEPQVIDVGSSELNDNKNEKQTEDSNERTFSDIYSNVDTGNHKVDLDMSSTDPISVLASDLRASNLDTVSAKSDSTRRSKSRGLKSRSVVESTAGTPSTGSISEHMLARPEFNSTLRVGKELQQLSEAELDVQAAVRQKLAKSNKTKAAIDEKATSRVNTSDSYRGLVSLEVQELDLIDSVERDRSCKAKPSLTAKGLRTEDALVSPPDILDCLTPDLIRETGSFNLSGIPAHSNSPRAAPFCHAFDVYRHIRTWENW